MRRVISLLTLLVLTTPLVALASSFSDVPRSSPAYDAITALSDGGIINGNPDGTFLPQIPVNRAAMLKLTYKAAGRVPAISSSNCFAKEFTETEWFAGYVCDAVARKFVKGYTDGTFRPNALVTFGEALKMIFVVLEIPAPAVTPADVSALPFRISPFAWYAPYIVAAYRQKILPLPTQDDSQFFVSDPIDRGQAAIMLYRAWQIRLTTHASSSSSSVDSSSSSSDVSSSSSSSSSSDSSVASSSSASSKPPVDSKDVSFPWSEKWQTSGSQPILYRFSLSAKTVASFETLLLNTPNATVNCRLYKIETDGFSPEYYLGIQDGQACHLKNALVAGDYQLEIQPSVPNAQFQIVATVTTGDNNDGMSEAQNLNLNVMRSGFLDQNDLEDWYVFTVPQGPKPTRSLMVQATGDATIHCTIYPWTDVSMASFAIPNCNASFDYPPGTYYVRLVHDFPLQGRQNYGLFVHG